LQSISPDVNGDKLLQPSQQLQLDLISTDQTITGFAADKFTINVSAINGTGGFTNGAQWNLFFGGAG